MEKTIYFAGGCFWGTQHFFAQLSGVKEALCGYANGNTVNPRYEEVYTDTTGFAETVKVTYYPEHIGLQELTELFFCIIDPLSLNRQGHDEGTRYRTGIYFGDPADEALLKEVYAREEARVGVPLVVELKPLRNFYAAEERHQDYLDKNPDGYCHLPFKAFRYGKLYQDMKLILGDEPDPVARMSQAVALIQERMGFFWTGFYRVLGQQLVLGPFQGPSACFRIGYGKGVCGTAWKQRRTMVVPDVEEFPGHIACSSLSQSEIVVPLVREGQVKAVLDIDSKELATFDATDALWLEKILDIL
ncbi:MAG: peptide-methionine (S)-S-oxide reductase MsrA [Bacteroidales bacterium]|nr:peptide-methionine (S)-S-oxide reductase MsrA [Bacteroidales bacterium]